MSKGDWTRPQNKKKFDEGYEAIFGKKKLNVWEDPPDLTKGEELHDPEVDPETDTSG